MGGGFAFEGVEDDSNFAGDTSGVLTGLAGYADDGRRGEESKNILT
jgi:hypothetical protein